ncbi:DUF6484 domain-containing protein [Enhygromyxa salina]|uniref:DUF6484 domain-containing protein n=1 Tax=Enhygromyxa salina TaxID=215803 RepID=UPI0004E6038F|nr:DUF6484 domain-containing protein [Enhygromyxa salina]
MSETAVNLVAHTLAGPADLRQGATIGRIAGITTAGDLSVEFSGNESGPVRARRIGVIPDDMLRQAERSGSPVVLVFENGDPALPMVLSICPVPDETPDQPTLKLSDPMPESTDDPLEVRVDGRRLILEGSEHIELRCGDASIELRADGTIKLRGRDIKSLARRRQRIAGGSVAIN